jgi:head-tail adaptor
VSGLARFLVHDVTLLTPTYVTDRYGDTYADWTQPPATSTAAKGWFTRKSTDEMADGREAITDVYELTLPAEVPTSDDMRVERDGRAYEIRGSVNVAPAPEGPHHSIVELRRVEG